MYVWTLNIRANVLAYVSECVCASECVFAPAIERERHFQIDIPTYELAASPSIAYKVEICIANRWMNRL